MHLIHGRGPFLFPLRHEPDGGVLLQVSVVVSEAPGARSAGSGRVPLRIQTSSGKTLETAAVGLLAGTAPASLTTEIRVPPGSHRIFPLPWPDRAFRFDVPGRPGSPVRIYCRHRSTHPSWLDMLGAVSPRGETLASSTVYSSHACCRTELPRHTKDNRGNVGGLGFLQALTRPFGARLAGGPVVVKPGEGLVVNPEESLAVWERAPFPLHCRHVVISRKSLEEFRASAGLAMLRAPWGFDPAPRPVPENLASSLVNLEDAMQRPPGPASEILTAASLNQFLSLLLREFPNRTERAWRRRSAESPMDPRLARAVRYLRAHYAQPYDRDALARHACCSRQLLQRLFARHLRQDPREYLMRIRVDRAKSLLAGCDRPVTQIARDVGYADVRNFRRVFERYARMPAQAFRKERAARPRT